MIYYLREHTFKKKKKNQPESCELTNDVRELLRINTSIYIKFSLSPESYAIKYWNLLEATYVFF